MKVIFLEGVPKVAKAGEVKDVADGYGKNYLIPKKLALQATAGALKKVEAQLKVQERIAAHTEAEFTEIANKIDGKEFTLEAQTGGKEKLYGSITSADIAAELEKSAGVVIDKRKIELADSIHQLGTYEIVIKLAKEITPKIKVTVAEKKE